jgi:TolA-binding protein
MALVAGTDAATSSRARSLTAIRSRSASRARSSIDAAATPSRRGSGDGDRVATPASGQPIRRQVEPNAHAARPAPTIPRVGALFSLRMRLVFILALLATTASAAPPTTCGGRDDYSKALCAYQRRQFDQAEAGFRAIADKADKDVTTIRALYFLARTEMKRGRFDEAAPLFVRIYGLDPAFYATWNCDFLLGECRRAMGKD